MPLLLGLLTLADFHSANAISIPKRLLKQSRLYFRFLGELVANLGALSFGWMNEMQY